MFRLSNGGSPIRIYLISAPKEVFIAPEPGKNTPFDPIASKGAQQEGITVICAGGRDIENTRAILEGKPFKGTKIG